MKEYIALFLLLAILITSYLIYTDKLEEFGWWRRGPGWRWRRGPRWGCRCGRWGRCRCGGWWYY